MNILSNLFWGRLLALSVVVTIVSGCGAIAVASSTASLTYTAAQTTVKAAGSAVRWTYKGAQNLARKVRGGSDDPDSDNAYSEHRGGADATHTASTSTIRLPEVKPRP